MKLADTPDWVQRLYWKWHGPVGHPQPRGEHYMSAAGVVQFFVWEAVLFCVLMIVLWGIKKMVTDGELAKWLTYIAIAIIGGAMLVKLIFFAGLM